jgi:dihydroorotase-like cyclic amidohydrolase
MRSLTRKMQKVVTRTDMENVPASFRSCQNRNAVSLLVVEDEKVITRFQVRRRHIRSPELHADSPSQSFEFRNTSTTPQICHFLRPRPQTMSMKSRGCTRKVEHIWRVPKQSYRVVSALLHDMVCLTLTDIGTRSSVVRCPILL